MDVLNISVKNTSIGLAFTLVLLLYYLLHRSKTSKAISPPEAGGAWPILGHLHLLGGSQLPHKTLASIDCEGNGLSCEGGLEEHRWKRDSDESNGEQDFMDVMLSTLEDTDLAGYDKAQEALDIHIGPVSGPREFTEDCIIGGYHISKGTRLTLNLWKLQRDPTIWPEPSEFRLERFVTSHKDVDVKGQHFELIPFGAGRRVCPGTLFGIQMLHLVLARWLDLGGHKKAMKETAKEMDCLVGGGWRSTVEREIPDI
ncbi:hypothetical protein ACSBR1_014975 [Camellia fascicularis]